MAPAIRFFRQDGAIKYRQNGTVYTVKEGVDINGTMIGEAVGGYLALNPVSASWSGISGKPDVFPPDTHVHLENAPAHHDHEGYANSTHVHIQYANATHTHQSSGGLTQAQILARGFLKC